MGFVLLTFGLVLGIVFGSYYLFVLRPETNDHKALRQRLQGAAATASDRSVVGKLERPADRLSALRTLDVVLARGSGVSGPLERMITQSGLKLTVGTLLLASAFLACVTFLLVKWATYYTYLGLAAAPFGAALPFLVVRTARAKRLTLFEEQFPEAIELLARALRAGHAFPTGLTMVADEIPAPVGAGPASVIDLERALSLLPDHQRIVVVLHDVEGYKHEEIAKQLGIASGTAKATLSRARSALRRMLNDGVSHVG